MHGWASMQLSRRCPLIPLRRPKAPRYPPHLDFAAVTPTRAIQRAPRGPAPQRLLSKGRTCIASAVVAGYRPWGIVVASKAPNEAQGPRVTITCGPDAPEQREDA